MAIGVLIVGDEILSGRRQDKHLAHAIEVLAARGLQLTWARYCGDDRALLTQTLAQCFATGDIVFSFGGIGATPDDHTRQAAAAALGVELALHPDAEREIRARYGAELTPLRLQLGVFPVGSTIVANPYNRIPGFSVADVHFLPGFPQMSWPMMESLLDARYGHLHHARAHAEASVAVFGAYESQLIELMTSLEKTYGVGVFSLPHLGSPSVAAHIELGAKGAPDAVAQAMEAMCQALTERGLAWRAVRDTRPGA